MDVLKTISSIGPEQTIIIYEAPLSADDLQCAVTREHSDIGVDEERFGEAIFIPNWREILLVIEKGTPTASLDPHNLRFHTATSYHIQAVRKGAIEDIMPVSVLGVVLTADGKFVLGVRRGRMAGGQIHVTPAGYASHRHKENPVFGTMLEELHEELGIDEEDLSERVLLAHESEPNTKGLAFIVLLRTTLSSEEIRARHKQAFAPYQKALDAGVEELAARKAIAEAGFANVDAWEHSELLCIDDSERQLQEIIDNRAVAHNGNSIPLVDACRGALMAYLEHKRKR